MINEVCIGLEGPWIWGRDDNEMWEQIQAILLGWASPLEFK